MLHEEGSFVQCSNAKTEKTMKARTSWQSCCILFSVAIAIAPVIQAADQKSILYARAIGEEPITTPETPAPPAKPPAPEQKSAPAKPAAATAPETKEAATPVSKTAVWIGIGVAALLAAAGGGGGGGGGGGTTTPPHPPQ